jgi:ribonuclease HI
VNPRNWLHPANLVSVEDTKGDGEETLWQIFTDDSNSEQRVGSGFAVFTGQELMEQLKFKLDNRCYNNQAEQLAILRALETIERQEVKYNENSTVVIYTDSKITMDSIRNARIHTHLIEEIRKRAVNTNKKN